MDITSEPETTNSEFNYLFFNCIYLSDNNTFSELQKCHKQGDGPEHVNDHGEPPGTRSRDNWLCMALRSTLHATEFNVAA